ncbi:MAG: hypothetical protein AAGK97_13345, partial [Bacteroidota bacterium]
ATLNCIVAWVLIHFYPKANHRTYKFNVKQHKLWTWIVFGLGTLAFGIILWKLFGRFPIDPKDSDIVPSIEMYVQRLLNNEYPYQPLPFEGYTVLPTYFPMMWLPYIPAELFGFDYRWIAYLVFLFGLVLFVQRLIYQDQPLWEKLLKIALLFAALIVYSDHERATFVYTVELMPIGLYLFLCYSINKRSVFLMAIAIVFCLLSRYAFTFWLPLYLLILFLSRGWDAVKVSILTGLGVLFIYVLPFLAKDPSILSNGLAYYDQTTYAEWTREHMPDPKDNPYQLTRGLGFAYHFLPQTGEDVRAQIAKCRKTNLVVSLLIAAFLLGIYFYFKPKEKQLKWFLIVGLKLYLLYFYAFIHMPFNYLYYLPFMLSFPILFEISLRKKQKAVAL